MDRQTIARILTETKPDIVYHVAAYKHVPIMEKNILQAIKNNIIGTRIVAEECIKGDIERCVLVSTDKAVRPTNVMGATKRVAELILQALANTESNTIFSIVRFGNVLGSSGSVIPLFTKQIKSGGPVTVTDPEVTRFFMTIQEAAQLVIQAGVLAKSGDVFVLDMGDPINISEVAEILIKLSGLKVRNADEPNGDIEIVYTGLRSGEKLHEELHISNIVEETPHPKIFAAQEKSISHKQMMKYFKRFDVAVDNADVEEIVKILYELVEGLELKFSDQPN
jgi:FlaA1/EpsC-like NDP-sugar epimerase